MVTGDCIWESWVCDKESDCSQAEDEENCHGTETGGGGTECTEFRCLRSGGCIPFSALCNGHQDCADNTDEEGCGLIMPGNIRSNGLKCMCNKYSMHFDRNQFDCGMPSRLLPLRRFHVLTPAPLLQQRDRLLRRN